MTKKLYQKRVIKITARIPTDEDPDVIAGFIVDALETWGGQLPPEEPLFQSLSVQSVTIADQCYTNPEPKVFDEDKE